MLSDLKTQHLQISCPCNHFKYLEQPKKLLSFFYFSFLFYVGCKTCEKGRQLEAGSEAALTPYESDTDAREWQQKGLTTDR